MKRTDLDLALIQLVEEIEKERKEKDQKTIRKKSPFSRQITENITSISELDFYISLNLKEKFVTRPALIAKIDPNFVDSRGKSNLEKMLKGTPPMDPNSKETYHLHHLGQNPEGPFIELLPSQHTSAVVFLILHNSKDESWRKNKSLQRDFEAQKKKHWIKRGKGFNEKQ